MNLALEQSYPTPLSHSPLLPFLLLSLARQRHTPDTSKRIKREYDFVIVGSGTAGSVVASRLSELPCADVLLLEAGHEPPLLTEVPALSKYFWFTDVDWQYLTAPQKHTGRALINRQVVWPAGKMLGGSSSMGGMKYARGNRKNYDDWAAQGAKGWSFKDVYPYFLKLEDNKEREFLANGYHTTGGPVSVHRPRYDSMLKDAVYKAAKSKGYKVVDSNAEKQTGFYEHQATLKDNQRCSTAKAYLVPAENRTNLDILANAMVTKIYIRKQQARGVQFEYKGHQYEVKARKEIILSAGSVNTAQLLMLSGIGPQEELEKLNIPVVADLPVGQNLQDHAATNVPFVLNPRLADFKEKISDRENIQEYIRNRTGPLASTEGTNYLAFLKGQAIYTPVDFPNYQLSFTETSASLLRHHLGLKPEVYRKLYGPYEGKPLFMCEVSQLQPKSRGTVTLRSKNPHDPPVIDPNYLQDPKDIEDMLQGMKTCQRLGTSNALRKLGARPLRTLIPGCEKYADDEDDYFTCQLRSILYTSHDPVGTAKMGHPEDETTVVDPQLRVKSIKGLRVVDASIMPTITSGNTMIPTIMIAEKASQMIKETIHCFRKELEHWEEEFEDSVEWTDEEEPPKDKWEEESPQDKWEDDVPCKEEYNDVPEQQWGVVPPPSHKWSPQDKNDYVDLPVKENNKKSSGDKYKSGDDDYSEEEDEHSPPKYSWSSDGKYYLEDYVKNPYEIASVADEKDSFWKSYAWHKKQYDLIMEEISKPKYTSWKNSDMHSVYPMKGPYNYAAPKSFEELVKLADMVPEEMEHGRYWSRSHPKSKAPPEPSYSRSKSARSQSH